MENRINVTNNEIITVVGAPNFPIMILAVQNRIIDPTPLRLEAAPVKRLFSDATFYLVEIKKTLSTDQKEFLNLEVPYRCKPERNFGAIRSKCRKQLLPRKIH